MNSRIATAASAADRARMSSSLRFGSSAGVIAITSVSTPDAWKTPRLASAFPSAATGRNGRHGRECQRHRPTLAIVVLGLFREVKLTTQRLHGLEEMLPDRRNLRRRCGDDETRQQRRLLGAGRKGNDLLLRLFEHGGGHRSP